MNLRENIVLSLLVSLLCFFVCELVSYCILQHPKYQFLEGPRLNSKDIVKNLYPGESHQELGWVLTKNSTHHAQFMKSNGTLVYDVHYTTDNYRRRRVSKTSVTNRENHLLLFGDSTAFGIGLKDQDTLQFQLEKDLPQHQIYNYSVFGYGPHQILKQLEIIPIEKQVQQLKGIALYPILSGHFMRAVGSSASAWGSSSPKYAKRGEQMSSEGSFKEVEPYKSKLLWFFSKLKNRSNLLTLLQIDIPIRVSDEHVMLVSEMIIKASSLYKQKFEGDFIVIVHPLFNLLPKQMNHLITQLKAAQVTVWQPKIEAKKELRIPIDGHPNARFNQLFSDKIKANIYGK